MDNTELFARGTKTPVELPMKLTGMNFYDLARGDGKGLVSPY